MSSSTSSLLIALALCGCTAEPAPRIVTRTIVRIDVVTVRHVECRRIPPRLLHCPADPHPPWALSPKSIGQYIAGLLHAADGCRANLEQISKLK